MVKDDCGSYAVFKEHGSSASPMTAANVIDIISRLPGCTGHAADAVSANTQVTNGGCSQIIENSQIGSVQTFGFVYHDTNGPNHGPVWKMQSFLLKGICMVFLWQDFYGEGNLRRSFWSMAGRKFQIVSLYIVKKDYSYLCMWKPSNWLERTKHWSDVESTQQRSRFGRTNISPGSSRLGMHSTTMPNKQRYCWQLQNHV